MLKRNETKKRKYSNQKEMTNSKKWRDGRENDKK